MPASPRKTTNSRRITLRAKNADDLGLKLLIAHGTGEGTLDKGIELGIELLLGMGTTALVHGLDSGLGSLGAESSGGAGELARGSDGTSTRHGGRVKGRSRREAG